MWEKKNRCPTCSTSEDHLGVADPLLTTFAVMYSGDLSVKVRVSSLSFEPNCVLIMKVKMVLTSLKGR